MFRPSDARIVTSGVQRSCRAGERMRLKLDRRTLALLRRLPVLNVYSIAEIALLALLALQVARLLWAIATPVGAVGDWRPAGPALPGSPFEIVTGFDPFFRLGGQQGATVVTPLQLTLFGTRMDEASGRGAAIVAGPDGVQQSVAVGAEIVPGVRLKSVAFDHVAIDRGGAEETLYLDQSGGAAPAVPGAPAAAPVDASASSSPVASAVGTAVGTGVGDQIRRDIAFTPRLDGGRISGLIVHPSGTGTLFRQANLRDGDVVTSIGGRPVTGPDDIVRVARDFAGGGNIPITVERGRDTLPLAITIAPPK